MFMSQWEMAKDESQTIFESGLEPFDEGIRAPTVGTFEIAVDYGRDGCSIGPCDMVIVLDEKRRFGICRGLAHRRLLLTASTDLSGNRVT
jgi:hypothetical protein